MSGRVAIAGVLCLMIAVSAFALLALWGAAQPTLQDPSISRAGDTISVAMLLAVCAAFGKVIRGLVP